MNKPFRDRLASLADAAELPRADTPELERLVRRRRTRRRLGTAIAVPIIALAVVLPVRALLELGEDTVGEDAIGGATTPGEFIAYAKNLNFERFEIWLVRGDGSGARPIDIPLPTATDPAWSPDGTTIAFSGTEVRNTEPTDIYLVRPDGSGFSKLTHNPDGVLSGQPTWSPDGSQLAYSRLDGREGGSGTSDLVIMDLDDGTERTIALPADFYQVIAPDWSPDGPQLAFGANREGIVGPYIVDVETGDLTKLVPDRHAGSGGPSAPSWSADGSRIAFEDNGDIFTVSLDDMSVTRLTDLPSMETAPTWSPDGRIVFLSGAARSPDGCWPPRDGEAAPAELCDHAPVLDWGALDVAVMNADGSAQTRLTSGGGIGYSPFSPAAPSWQPVAAELTTEQPTAESIIQNGGPVGKELADAMGLELQSGFEGDCSFYVEINDSHEGYCLEGLSGDNHAKQWVIGEALRGRVVTAAELARVEETLG